MIKQDSFSFLDNMERKSALGVAYGLGVDSTAVLVNLVKLDIRPDFILFADLGAEKKSTYAYLPVMQEFLKENNFPEVTIVKNLAPKSPYNDIEGNMVMNATLPSEVFGYGACSMKWKINPQDKWQKANFAGFEITKAVGYEAEETNRSDKVEKEKAKQNKTHGKSESAKNWYPLQEWGWTREECKARIAEAGLPVPPKSSCIFCPNMKPHELMELTAEERGRIVRVEAVAEPYNQKVYGLWRKPSKKHEHKGSMSEYMIRKNIPFVHPDELEPMELNPNCQKFKNGVTFQGPHNEYSICDAIGGCQCAEHAVHAQVVEELFKGA